ncbi:N-acetyl-alpha-D-glucosaminyl L-malate deacetylase 1 [Planctomycetaceae bacterium]|nr:N-acetyl-alpha-D-glucosaminyl L-malate deacetylase 1 [Planctomycetaceae bacterium]
MSKPLDLLAIGAHPDDVEMTSGGWLCQAARQGYRTGILHLTRGEMGTRGTPEQREREAKAAAKALGCRLLEFAGMRDGFIHAGDEAVRVLVDLLRRLAPKIVIAPYMQCHHPDHEAAAELCIKAVHFAGLRGYVTEFPHHRVKRLVHARYSQHFEPSFFVDISGVIEKKRAAIECYSSQFEPAQDATGESLTRMSRAGFVDQFLSGNAQMGLRAGCAWAEAYWMRVAPIIDDPIDLLGQGPSHHLLR